MSRRSKVESGPVYYTTFQVARLLGVSAPTVVNWVKSGLLVAHRTPGGHRRIARADLVRFAEQHDYPVPGAAEAGAETGPAAGRRILVVDDQREFCNVVRDFLQLRGDWRVETADSGFAAGLTVARFRPEVILMDILMPDMDGFEVIRMLKADAETREIPVIACTAVHDPAIRERVHREGFVGCLEKPLRLEGLAEAIDDILEQARGPETQTR